MSHGGHRPGAGRPKGSRDRVPRRPSAPPPVDSNVERAFLEACSAFVATGEPFRILREFLESKDPSRRAWALDKILSYGVGLPAKRPEPPAVDASVQQLFGAEALDAMARARLARRGGQPLLKPAATAGAEEPVTDAELARPVPGEVAE